MIRESQSLYCNKTRRGKTSCGSNKDEVVGVHARVGGLPRRVLVSATWRSATGARVYAQLLLS